MQLDLLELWLNTPGMCALKYTGGANHVKVCLLAGLWNLESCVLYQTYQQSLNPRHVPWTWTRTGNYTGWRIPATTRWNSRWMKRRLDGRGGDLTCYICNKLRGEGRCTEKVSRQRREKKHQRGTSTNLHWASSFKKIWKSQFGEILVFFAEHKRSRYD